MFFAGRLQTCTPTLKFSTDRGINHLGNEFFVVEDMEKSSPFESTVTVRWGDCDPAGIIYTPRILEYAIVAMENWFTEILGVSWYELNMHHGLGSPTVRAECDFLLILRAGQQVNMNVQVQNLGNSSLTVLVTGFNSDQAACFKVSLVFCFIKRPEFKSTPIPDRYRKRIETYIGNWENNASEMLDE